MKTKEQYMKDAIHQAHKALKADEVPIGCVIVHDGKIIARGWNEREKKQISCSHAEIEAIQKACRKLGTWRLEDCDLYVTLEPCPMCAGAIIQSRLRNVYFGAYDPKGGAAGSVTDLFSIEKWNHHPHYEGGILEEECSQLLTNFFREKRRIQKEKKKQKQLALEQEALKSEAAAFTPQQEGALEPEAPASAPQQEGVLESEAAASAPQQEGALESEDTSSTSHPEGCC